MAAGGESIAAPNHHPGEIGSSVSRAAGPDETCIVHSVSLQVLDEPVVGTASAGWRERLQGQAAARASSR